MKKPVTFGTCFESQTPYIPYLWRELGQKLLAGVVACSIVRKSRPWGCAFFLVLERRVSGFCRTAGRRCKESLPNPKPIGLGEPHLHIALFRQVDAFDEPHFAGP
jgi:hypothetical protein